MLMKYKYGGDYMKTKTLLWACAAVLFAAMVAGCVSTPQKQAVNTVELKEKEVSFTSEDGTLSIQNNTNKDVVVFVGKVEKSTMIGGIKAGKTRKFDLAKISGIPNNGSLLVRVATIETYKKKARITEDDVIYTGLVVYDLNDPRDITHLTIYDGIDTAQKHCLYLTNNSEHFVLEVRSEVPNGEVIATLGPMQSDKRVFLNPKDTGKGYKLFPVFVYVDPKTHEKTVINVPGKEECQVMDPDPVGTHLTPVIFDEPKNNNLSYSLAFITIQNDTKAGFEFRNSRTSLPNQRGRRFTAPGRSDVYEIETGKGKDGRLYTALTCVFNEYKEMTLEAYQFLPGYMYDIVLTDRDGKYEYDIREVGKKSFVENAKIQLFNEEL